MWDADLVSRVRDRKLNEIMIFASMAKIDSQNIDGYIDIIVSLGDDIDACDTLLDTDGETEIALEAIDAPEYLDRLSPGERSDEDAFNAMKVDPCCEEAVPEDLGDYVRQLISDAVESLKGDDGSRDALDALKEELAMVRNRNEELSKDLDFRMTENASLSDELKAVQSERDELQSQVDSLRACQRPTSRWPSSPGRWGGSRTSSPCATPRSPPWRRRWTQPSRRTPSSAARSRH